MIVKFIKRGLIEFYKECGVQTSLPIEIDVTHLSELSDDEVASYMYKKGKQQALTYFNQIWAARTSPMHPIIEEIPIIRTDKVLNENTGVEELVEIVIRIDKKDITPICWDDENFAEKHLKKFGKLPYGYRNAMAPDLEPIRFMDFKFIEPKAHKIIIDHTGQAIINSSYYLGARVIDQYGEFMKVLPSKKVNTSELGSAIYTFTDGTITEETEITVTLKTLTETEKMQVLSANMLRSFTVPLLDFEIQTVIDGLKLRLISEDTSQEELLAEFVRLPSESLLKIEALLKEA